MVCVGTNARPWLPPPLLLGASSAIVFPLPVGAVGVVGRSVRCRGFTQVGACVRVVPPAAGERFIARESAREVYDHNNGGCRRRRPRLPRVATTAGMTSKSTVDRPDARCPGWWRRLAESESTTQMRGLYVADA